MSSLNTKNKIQQDWHPWDIKAALGKKGYSLAKIAREYGYASTSPNKALYRPWAAIEQIIASIIGVKAWKIWPSRYGANKKHLKSRYTITLPKRKKVCNG